MINGCLWWIPPEILMQQLRSREPPWLSGIIRLSFSNPWIHGSFHTSAHIHYCALFADGCRCHYYVEGGWGWVVLGASVVSTLLTCGCQWTIMYYLSHWVRPPAIIDWPSSLHQKGRKDRFGLFFSPFSFFILFFPMGHKRPGDRQGSNGPWNHTGTWLIPRRAQRRTSCTSCNSRQISSDKWQPFAAWCITVRYWNPVCQACHSQPEPFFVVFSSTPHRVFPQTNKKVCGCTYCRIRIANAAAAVCPFRLPKSGCLRTSKCAIGCFYYQQS